MSTLAIILFLALLLTCVSIIGGVVVIRRSWPAFKAFLEEARKS